jgi:hypothetical protein
MVGCRAVVVPKGPCSFTAVGEAQGLGSARTAAVMHTDLAWQIKSMLVGPQHEGFAFT